MAAGQAVAAVLRQKKSLAQVLPPLAKSLESSQQALLHELCFGTLRHGWQLRGLLRPLLRKSEAIQDRYVLALMLVGIYQIEHTRIPEHAAVHETVEACRKLGKGWACGLLNGVLREYLRRREACAAGLTPHEQDGLPQWLADMLHTQWGPKNYRELVCSWKQTPFLCLRVNLRQGSRESYLQQLAAAGIEARPCTHTQTGISLQQWQALHTLPGFHSGACSVQDVHAQVAVPLLEARPGERILDACAAPGGKLAQLLEACDGIQLTALDIDSERLALAEENLQRLNLARNTQVQLRQADAAARDSWWDGTPFDRILLDVPCSAIGVIRRHPDILYLRRAADLTAFMNRQAQLLCALWPCLKPGGTLLYVSCSILHQENQLCIASFAKQRPDVECVAMKIPGAVEHAFGYTLLPRPCGGDGLFFARLKRRPV